MPIITFETCIFISYKPPFDTKGSRLSSVVLHELTVGASDSAEIRYWDSIRKDFEKSGKLLVPNGEDWFLAGKSSKLAPKRPESRAKGKNARDLGRGSPTHHA